MPASIVHTFYGSSGRETLTYSVAVNSSGEYEATSSGGSTVATAETRDRLRRAVKDVVLATAGRHFAKHA